MSNDSVANRKACTMHAPIMTIVESAHISQQWWQSRASRREISTRQLTYTQREGVEGRGGDGGVGKRERERERERERGWGAPPCPTQPGGWI